MSAGSSRRRQFTAAYKQAVLGELDACAERGERSAILEREDLLWSHVAKWRRQRESGRLEDSWADLSPQGRLMQLLQERDALLDEIDRLRGENVSLRREVGRAAFGDSVRQGLDQLLRPRPAPGKKDDAPAD